MIVSMPTRVQICRTAYLFAANSCTFLPAKAEPVKLILLMSIWLASAAPTFPSPVTMLITPGGKPASLIRLPNCSIPMGDFSEPL
jgi:hypothetical protein